MKNLLIILTSILVLTVVAFLGYHYLKIEPIQEARPSIAPTATETDPNTFISDLNAKIDESIPDKPMRLGEYQAYLDSLDKTDANSIQKGLKTFQKNLLNYSQADKERAFTYYNVFFHNVISKFEDAVYRKGILEKIGNEVRSKSNDVIDFNELLGILNNPNKTKKDPQVQELTELLYFNGMKFEMSEGTIYIASQPDFLFNNFGPYLPEAFRDYLAITKEHDSEIWVDDACLLISFEDLGDRIIAWENFMEKYPEFEYYQDIKETHDRYLRFFLMGLDNSPLFNYPDDLLDPNIQKAYENYIQKNGARESGKLVNSYYELLEAEGFKKGPKIDQFYKDNNL